MNESKKTLGSLQRVDLRDFWEDEAREFTPWLAQEQNLRLLGEAIDIELECEATESRVGAFKADIVAKEVGTEDRVIIENQLERTNHDHLGKLLTYASGLGARVVVWVASEITDEHRRALDWLNEITGEQFSFFALEIELWRIGNSEPAPKFNLVCRPNDWAKSLIGPESPSEPTETKLSQLEFWKGLVDFAKAKGTALSLRKPRPQHWYNLAVGRSQFNLSSRPTRGSAESDAGSTYATANRRRLSLFFKNREAPSRRSLAPWNGRGSRTNAAASCSIAPERSRIASSGRSFTLGSWGVRSLSTKHSRSASVSWTSERMTRTKMRMTPANPGFHPAAEKRGGGFGVE